MRRCLISLSSFDLKALADPHSVSDVYSPCSGDIQLWIRQMATPRVSLMDQEDCYKWTFLHRAYKHGILGVGEVTKESQSFPLVSNSYPNEDF